MGRVGLFRGLESVKSFVSAEAHAETLSGEEESLVISFSRNSEEMPDELESLAEFKPLTVATSGIGESKNIMGLFFDRFLKKAEAF